MKQILQNLSSGETTTAEIPCPNIDAGEILVATKYSLISAGTERMLVDFGKAGYINKALQQPDKVKMVVDKVKADGVLSTVDSIKSKLDQPLPLGYCNSGVVIDSRADGFELGDRIISNGYHSEVVRVPKNLCAKIPENVSDESASFTVLASVGLQGIRLASPTLGESVVVFGLGLVGLMTLQMLRANGCRVLGVDFDSARCELARGFGAETIELSNGCDPVQMANVFSRGRGVDAVIVCASTKSHQVVHQAAQMCRKRGRVVLVGVVGLNLRRDDFYNKEITFQVSSSYGPGRYDPNYEEKGHDYPYGYVRWTEQRNFEAVLDMMSSGALDVSSLVTHKFDIDESQKAYDILNEPSTMGVLLSYPTKNSSELCNRVVNLKAPEVVPPKSTEPRVGFIGAGNYASRILIPAFQESNVQLDSLATNSGVSGVHYGKKSGFSSTTTDLNVLWDDKNINTVVIASRHNTHASQVCAALEAGKHVFVEKPLALKINELEEIDATYRRSQAHDGSKLKLMVGFNRRFAPQVTKIKSLLKSKVGPCNIVMTVNAGLIPENHWTQDPEIGGGRIIGEACHFIDLLRFLIGNPITDFSVNSMSNANRPPMLNDNVTISLSFSDGSLGVVHYFSNGGRSFPKERIDIFANGSVLQLDNFRKLKGYDWPEFKKMRLLKQDKGQKFCVKAFVDSIREAKLSPIPYEEIMEVSKITIEVTESLASKEI